MICFESIFNYKSINTEVCNADMVIQISNDSWFGKWYGPHQHLANSLLRSVEFQKPLIRSTPSGITSVVDYSGKIIGVLILLNNLLFGSLRNFEYCSSLTNDFPFFLPKYLFFDSNI